MKSMNPKIVVVEHDSASIELIHDELEKSEINFTSKIVQTEKEYKKAIRHFKPDLILSLYTFPDFDGPAALKIKNRLSPEIPFIFVSESNGEEAAIKWIKNGVTDFVPKGNLSSLTVKMSRALQEAKVITLNTQKHQAEEKRIEKLSFNAQKYYSVIESSMDAILLTVKDGRILEVNTAACEIFQMTREEIYKSGRFDLVDKEDPRLQLLLEERNRAGRARGELTFKRKDGSRFQGEITSVVFKDADGLEKTSMTIEDISKRKQAELALKVSESFTKGVLDSLNSHIAVINSKGTILKVNKSWNTFSHDNGGGSDDKFGEGANYFDACSSPNDNLEDNTSEVLKGIKDVLNGLIKEYYFEYPCHSPAAQRWFNMTAKIFESSETLVLIEHHDITDRKQAELKQILTSNALEEALREKNKILDSSLDVICSIDEEGRFVSVNAASEYIWGYTPDELLGKKYIDFVFHEDTKSTVEEDTKIRSDIPARMFENRYVHKNGKIVSMLWSCHWVAKDKKSYAIAKDVTERKKLEKAFDIEQQQFADLYSQAPSCMGILKGPNYVYEMANPLYLKLINKKNIIGKTVKEVLPEIESQGVFKFLDTVYKTGKTFSANEMLVKFDLHGNGKLVNTYLNYIYQAHRDSNGIIDGILFFVNDVTEQVLLRKKIEENEKKYRYLFVNNPMPMWISDKNTSKFLDVNEMAILQYGYSREEFLSMTAVDIRPEEDKEHFIQLKNSDEIIKTDQNRGVWNHLKKDGTVITVEIIAQKIIYEGVKSRFILSKDITDRKKAELNLENRNKEIADYKFAMDESSIVGITDRNGIIISANDNFCKISKYSREELIGQNHNILSSRYHSKEFMQNLWKTIANGKTWKGEIKNKAKDGVFYWVDTTIIPFLDAHGKPYQYFATRFDITNLKNAELKLELQNKELAFQNVEKENRAADLIIANKELAFQNAEKENRANELIGINTELLKTNGELDRFVYSVSHDLRSPLTSILGLISIIEEESQETETLEHMEMIKNSVNRLDKFIKNILSYSRNKRTGLEVEIISPQDTATEIVDSLLGMKEAEGIRFEIDISEQQSFYSDRLRFNTVLENLISNAIKYHQKDQLDNYIKITGESDQDALHLIIKDNGIGIAAKHHDKIFDMFYRLSGKKDGSGIGLYIVKETVQILQGSIEVQSEEGKGTSFYITLKNLKP